jgi:hypothetical protein
MVILVNNLLMRRLAFTLALGLVGNKKLTDALRIAIIALDSCERLCGTNLGKKDWITNQSSLGRPGF